MLLTCILYSCGGGKRDKVGTNNRFSYPSSASVFINFSFISRKLLIQFVFFLAEKNTEELTYQEEQQKIDWVSDAVLIGAVTGIVLGFAIVSMTILSVSICMKKGII